MKRFTRLVNLLALLSAVIAGLLDDISDPPVDYDNISPDELETIAEAKMEEVKKEREEADDIMRRADRVRDIVFRMRERAAFRAHQRNDLASMDLLQEAVKLEQAATDAPEKMAKKRKIAADLSREAADLRRRATNMRSDMKAEATEAEADAE